MEPPCRSVTTMMRKKKPDVVSKYIEVVSGAEFGIRWELCSPWPPSVVLLRYWLDQKRVGGTYCKPKHFKHSAYAGTRNGVRTVINGQGFLHKFAFAALTIDDISAPVQDQLMNQIKGMGQIIVKAFFVKNLRTIGVVDRALKDSIRDVGKIPEKALKGRSLTHQASLRACQPTTATSAATCDYIDPAKQPFATYIFKYRSRDALKSLLIVPRSPSPVPLEERRVDTLSGEEMRELLRRLREYDAAAQTMKQEGGIKRELERERSSTCNDDADEDELSIVSTKRRRETYQTTINENGVEEIDLT